MGSGRRVRRLVGYRNHVAVLIPRQSVVHAFAGIQPRRHVVADGSVYRSIGPCDRKEAVVAGDR